MPQLVIQFVSGIWYMPQMSFFPIYLQEQLGLAPVAISALVAASQAAGMVAGVVGGVLCDAFGGKRVPLLGLFGASLASVAFLTTVAWLVALLWAIGGLAVGFHTLGGSSYLTKVADRRYVGLLAAFYELTLMLGGARAVPPRA